MNPKIVSMASVPMAVLLHLASSAPAQGQLEYIVNPGNTITITAYTGTGGAVDIPGSINGLPVITIGDSAFASSGVTSITIGDGVTSIGEDAFESCHKLTSVAIPASVTNIEDQLFMYCTSLTTITVNTNNPDYSSLNGVLFDQGKTTLIEYPAGLAGSYVIPGGVTNISDYAFFDTAVASVTIPASVAVIGTNAFASCASLTNALISNGVASIEDYAFYETSLSSATVPDSVTNLGAFAFGDCYQLTTAVIPGSVASIGADAFESCGLLTNFTIGDGVGSIDEGAFQYCGLTDLVIPGSVTNIEDTAFLNCYGLTNLTMGDGVVSIGEAAFAYCEGLTNLTLPDSLTSMGSQAFGWCSGLNNLTIPASVTNIGDYAFEYCSSLSNVFFQGNAPAMGADVFFDDDATVYYLPGTTGWSSPFANRQALLWNPQIETGGINFGVESNQFGFNITGTAYIPIVVEACSNLANPVWSPVATNILTNGSFYFRELVQTNVPGRYYRISPP